MLTQQHALRYAVLIIAAWLTLPGSFARAEDDDAKKKAAAAETSDRYTVPEGDVKALMAFIEGLDNIQIRSREQLSEYRQKAPRAKMAAVARILELEKDKTSDAYRFAENLAFQFKVATTIAELPTPQQAALIDEIKSRLNERGITPDDVGFASEICRQLDYGGKTELATRLYTAYGELLSQSKDEKIADRGQKFIGAARRLKLLGNPIELAGTTVDGSPFDWASYRGKVVLIDFWATWCGPCIAELPNVKRNYERYHEKGFDVVGVNLDEDREALDAFLAREKSPWTNIREGGGFKSHLATYYGIMGIPTVMLADKEGKIVSLNARGPELGRLLEKLLGPADAAASDEKSEAK